MAGRGVAVPRPALRSAASLLRAHGDRAAARALGAVEYSQRVVQRVAIRAGVPLPPAQGIVLPRAVVRATAQLLRQRGEQAAARALSSAEYASRIGEAMRRAPESTRREARGHSPVVVTRRRLTTQAGSQRMIVVTLSHEHADPPRAVTEDEWTRFKVRLRAVIAPLPTMTRAWLSVGSTSTSTSPPADSAGVSWISTPAALARPLMDWLSERTLAQAVSDPMGARTLASFFPAHSPVVGVSVRLVTDVVRSRR